MKKQNKRFPRRFIFDKAIKFDNERQNINVEVLKLIKQYKSVRDNYYENTYKILKKILILRRKQIKKYNEYNLAREEGIDLTTHQIKYIFGYEYLSVKSKQLIKENKLKLSTALYVIRQNKNYQNGIAQNIAIEKYLSGKLNTTQISRLNSNIIVGKEPSNDDTIKANQQLIVINTHLQEMLKILRTKKDLFSENLLLKRVITQVRAIEDECDTILKFGKSIKKKESYIPSEFMREQELFN